MIVLVYALYVCMCACCINDNLQCFWVAAISYPVFNKQFCVEMCLRCSKNENVQIVRKWIIFD